MKFKPAAAFCIFFGLAVISVANPDTAKLTNPGALFDSANQAYKKQNYHFAVRLYDSIYQAGYTSANLFYNMGNCYYKLEKIPEAILFYEKAQKYSGFRPDIAYNLSIAEEQITDKINAEKSSLFSKWWNNTVRYFSLQQWGVLSVVLVWATIICIAGFLFLHTNWLNKLSLVSGIVIFFLFAASLILTFERFQYTTGVNHGVVFAPSVYVKSAPDQESKDLFILHSGVKVKLMDELDDWKKIQLPDGKQGWVKKQTLRMI